MSVKSENMNKFGLIIQLLVVQSQMASMPTIKKLKAKRSKFVLRKLKSDKLKVVQNPLSGRLWFHRHKSVVRNAFASLRQLALENLCSF